MRKIVLIFCILISCPIFADDWQNFFVEDIVCDAKKVGYIDGFCFVYGTNMMNERTIIKFHASHIDSRYVDVFSVEELDSLKGIARLNHEYLLSISRADLGLVDIITSHTRTYFGSLYPIEFTFVPERFVESSYGRFY